MDLHGKKPNNTRNKKGRVLLDARGDVEVRRDAARAEVAHERGHRIEDVGAAVGALRHAEVSVARRDRSDDDTRIIHGQTRQVGVEPAPYTVAEQILFDVRCVKRADGRSMVADGAPTARNAFSPAKSPTTGTMRLRSCICFRARNCSSVAR